VSQFEFVTVLFSLVVAFGVSELLAGWGRSYRTRVQIRPFPLQIAATGLLLLALLQTLWGYWGFRNVTWSFWLFLVAIGPLLPLAGATFLITPSRGGAAEGDSDARSHYFSVAPAMFVLLSSWVVLGTVAEVLLIDFSFHVGHAVRAIAILLLLVLMRSTNPVIHWWGLGGLAVLQLLFVGSVTPGLS
jgi:hypothetical protein